MREIENSLRLAALAVPSTEQLSLGFDPPLTCSYDTEEAGASGLAGGSPSLPGSRALSCSDLSLGLQGPLPRLTDCMAAPSVKLDW
eukprot:844256-Amphidinium_carterae.2